jgi:hypothetical protein
MSTPHLPWKRIRGRSLCQLGLLVACTACIVLAYRDLVAGGTDAASLQPAALWSPSSSLSLGAVDARRHQVRVTYENRSNDSVHIAGVVKGCDCAVVDWPPGPILPGEEVTLGIDWDLSDRRGAQSTTLFVQCDRGSPPRRENIRLVLLAESKSSDPDPQSAHVSSSRQ